jgi:hypothetical protein
MQGCKLCKHWKHSFANPTTHNSFPNNSTWGSITKQPIISKPSFDNTSTTSASFYRYKQTPSVTNVLKIIGYVVAGLVGIGLTGITVFKYYFHFQGDR